MKKKKQSLVWEIHHPKAPGVSYLLGTMHTGNESAFCRLQDMFNCIYDVDTYAGEVHLENLMEQVSAEDMDLPEGTTLQSLLGKKKFKKYRKIIWKSFGIDIELMNNSKPMHVTSMITAKIHSEKQARSLDEVLWMEARKTGKIMLGVETVEEQKQIMERIPLKFQLKQLKDLVKNVGKVRKQLKSAKDFTKKYVRNQARYVAYWFSIAI